MCNTLKIASILCALFVVILVRPASAQATRPAYVWSLDGSPGHLPFPLVPPDPDTLMIRVQGATNLTDGGELRGELFEVFERSLSATARSNREFTLRRLEMHGGRFDAVVYCHDINFRAAAARGGRGGSGGRGMNPPPPNQLDTAAQIISFLQAQLKLRPEEAAWTPDQRAERIAAISNELSLYGAQETLGQAERKAGSDSVTLIAGRITALRNQIQTVGFDLKAKEIRRTALEMAMAQRQKRDTDAGAIAEKDDAIVSQLRQLVDLHKQQLQTMESQFKSGTAGRGDLEASQSALVEAEIRLAERINELHGSGNSELISRLTDELALASVDLTELNLRLHDLTDQLDLYEKAGTDSTAMTELMHAVPELAEMMPGTMPATLAMRGVDPYYASAAKNLERLLLSVSDLTFTDATAPEN